MQSRRLTGLSGLLALLLASLSTLNAADTNPVAKATGAGAWTPLFDGKTTQGWRGFKKETFPDKGWVVEDGWLHCLGKGGNKGGGDIVTVGEFGDFELEWDWKQAPGGNSGIKYFILESRNSAIGHEYQMIDDKRHEDAGLAEGKRVTASFYDVLKPSVPTPTKEPGKINHSRILVRGNHVEHWLNGTKVLEYESGSDAVKAAIAKSKFKDVPGFENSVRGHILLQDHNSEIWFRDIKIRAASPN